jgi:hypothetical protein
MNISIKIVSLIAAIFYMFSLKGQQTELNEFYNDYLMEKQSNPEYFDKIEGSPYKNPEFVEALVYMNGSGDPVTGKMRYNNYQDEMEFQKEENGDILLLQNKNTLDSILLINNTYLYLNYIDDKELASGYFVRLINKECKLYFRSTIKYREEKIPKTGYEKYEPASFIRGDDLFFVGFEDLPLIEIPRRNKKMQELFREYGFENKEMSKVKYNETELVNFFRGLKKIKDS